VSETLLRNAIRNAIIATGKAYLAVNSRGFRGHVPLGLMPDGSADLIGLVKSTGRYFALEVKLPKATKKGDPARLAKQAAWAETIRSYGGYAVRVTSVDEALAALTEAQKENANGIV
jgi:hypothetical protein